MTAEDQIEPEYPFMHLISADLIELREAKVIPRLPYITRGEIDDKSKGDVFVRLIAIGQIGWIVIQIIVRGARGLPISQLEIAVVAFAACAISMYVVNWKRPKGGQVAHKLSCFQQMVPQSIGGSIRKRRDGPGYLGTIKHFWLRATSVFYDTFTVKPKWELGSNPVPNSFRSRRNLGWWRGSKWGATLSLMLFGVVHLAAWNFDFPTKAEMILWRIASIRCAAFGVIYFVLVGVPWLLYQAPRPDALLSNSYLYLTLLGPPASYTLARTFLLVEVFRSLCFLPPEAYISTWASYVPHFS
jgi:hypothetical protein